MRKNMMKRLKGKKKRRNTMRKRKKRLKLLREQPIKEI